MTGAAACGLARLTAALDARAAAGGRVALWWRDDDLERPSPALDRLLVALGEHGIVPALAAVPGRLAAETAAIVDGTGARLLVHGWRHADHAGPGAKKSEYGPERPLDVRLAEIAAARRRLADLAGDRMLAWFVPPWNRIAADLAGRLGEAGFDALSGFAPRGRPAPCAGVPRLDTHVDLIDWRGTGAPLATPAVAALLAERLADPADGAESRVDGPVGILSHHLVTDAAAWRDWRPLLAALAGHPAVLWLDPAAALAVAVTATAGRDEKRRIG